MKRAKLIVTTAMLVILVVVQSASFGNADEKKYLTIKGSDTMVHLVSNWAETYMRANPAVNISVTGGGSGTGIAALLNGTTDICMASRDIKAKEIEFAKRKGITPKEFVVARDGISVVVNPKNPVSVLSIEQIGALYTGEYTNWNQVGGPDKKVVILSRESSSGTYVFFQEHVLQKQDYTPKARLMPANAAIVQSVSDDQWTIGYVGLGFAAGAKGKIKVLGVKAADSLEAVAPSEETVASGKYSIARPLLLYTNGEPTGLIQSFIEFTKSDSGQEIVRQTGFVPTGESTS
jgi:phosphate transport system substrate-binding protein